MYYRGLGCPSLINITGYLLDGGSIRDLLQYDAMRYSASSGSTSPTCLLLAPATIAEIEANWPTLTSPPLPLSSSEGCTAEKRPLVGLPLPKPTVSGLPVADAQTSLSLRHADAAQDIVGLASSRSVQTDELLQPLIPDMLPADFAFRHLAAITSGQLPGLSEAMPRLLSILSAEPDISLHDFLARVTVGVPSGPCWICRFPHLWCMVCVASSPVPVL